MGDLIPGLPEDVARECLLRVGFRHLPAARHTSRQWKAEVESPLYSRLRRANAMSRPLLALAQALPPLAASGPARKYAASAALSSSYRLVLHDPADGGWATLPPLPGGAGLPLFCQLAAVSCRGERTRLVVLGGWDPETWTTTDAVHVYDFLEGAWRRGAPMPGPRRRSFFACAAAGQRVFVAGGHDEEKNALRSAAAYDAEADAWAALPDMALERDEARGVCVGGRFVVVGGYPTEAQGRFTGTGEAFDTASWAWEPVQDRMVEEGACPMTCCAAPSAAGTMYMLRDGYLAARDSGSPWRSVARVPEDGRAATAVVAIGGGRVVVVGAGRHGGEQAVYVLSEQNGAKGTEPSWATALAPPEFAGHVQAACCVDV